MPFVVVKYLKICKNVLNAHFQNFFKKYLKKIILKIIYKIYKFYKIIIKL